MHSLHLLKLLSYPSTLLKDRLDSISQCLGLGGNGVVSRPQSFDALFDSGTASFLDTPNGSFQFLKPFHLVIQRTLLIDDRSLIHTLGFFRGDDGTRFKSSGLGRSLDFRQQPSRLARRNIDSTNGSRV